MAGLPCQATFVGLYMIFVSKVRYEIMCAVLLQVIGQMAEYPLRVALQYISFWHTVHLHSWLLAKALFSYVVSSLESFAALYLLAAQSAA